MNYNGCSNNSVGSEKYVRTRGAISISREAICTCAAEMRRSVAFAVGLWKRGTIFERREENEEGGGGGEGGSGSEEKGVRKGKEGTKQKQWRRRRTSYYREWNQDQESSHIYRLGMCRVN